MQKIAADPFGKQTEEVPYSICKLDVLPFPQLTGRITIAAQRTAVIVFIAASSKFRLIDCTSFALQSQILSKITTFKINVVASIIFEKTYLLCACQFKTKTF